MFLQKLFFSEGGIADSPRSAGVGQTALCSTFDIFSDPAKITPYRSSLAQQTSVSVADLSAYDVRHFQLGLDGKEYGLGVSSTFPQILRKSTPISGNWDKPATSAGNAVRVLGAFIEWQTAFWFFEGTNKLSKWAIGGAVTDGVATLSQTITTVAQGCVGPDNNLYVFYNNQVARVSPAGVVTDAVLTALPSDMRITSVARYGDKLAIGMAYGTSATATPSGRSQVFLWDMVTTTTVSDVIDWGDGALMVLGNIEGQLVGVTDKYLSSNLGASNGSMVVRVWAGGIPRVHKEIVANQIVTLGRFLQDVVIKNNKMYWVASVPFGSSTSTESTFHLGIWVFGRKNMNGNFALALDYVEENVSSSNFYINSFGAAGDYWFINHSSTFAVHSTLNTATYSFTSIVESPILNTIALLRGHYIGDSSITKQLNGVTVNFVPLPSGASVTLKYRKNEETSYTTIFTYSTTSGISHSAINIESSGAVLPQYKEIQFRVESTGGAEILGLKYKGEVIDKDFY